MLAEVAPDESSGVCKDALGVAHVARRPRRGNRTFTILLRSSVPGCNRVPAARVRHGAACRASAAMLAEGDMPIVEVALSVGFQTQAHFSTVFKRLTGASPARWRLSRPGRTQP